MATFDISRVAFDPKKHYTSVRMQQGRILMDDDWNENERIEDEIQRRINIDVIGPYGSPDDGFLISTPVVLANGFPDFTILAGTLYLGGLRLDMDIAEVFQQQTDWFQLHDQTPVTLNEKTGQRTDLVYIEAWQQPVCAVEDTSLLEPALGGPDTTTRVRNMRRVKLFPMDATDCATAWKIFKKQKKIGGVINEKYELVTDVRLTVEYTDDINTDNLCAPPVQGGYLGADNQAIRVQLTDNAHFTWGFDNSAPLYRVELGRDMKTITMTTTPKDEYHWPLSGQVVELIPVSAVLSNSQQLASQGEGSHFSFVDGSYDPDEKTFTLKTPLPGNTGFNSYVFLRVWNRGTDQTPTEVIPFAINTPVKLGNTGLQITITGNNRNKEDYWVIAARPQQRRKVIPWELETGMPPFGIKRFFAPLGIIRWTDVAGTIKGELIRDCRIKFRPLTKLKCRSCSCVIEPGDNWQDFFDKVRRDKSIIDIQVCFKPGEYKLSKPIVLSNKGVIKMTGSRTGSRIIANGTESAFVFEGGTDVVIRDLYIEATAEKREKNTNGVISINDREKILLENVSVEFISNAENRIKDGACVSIKNSIERVTANNSIHILNSEFTIGPKGVGILIVNPIDLFIENNRLSGAAIGRQGIVIGGTVGRNIHITGNCIENISDGIHVGLSYRKEKSPSAARDPESFKFRNKVAENYTTGAVMISGNNISVNGKETSMQGIFVGNCNSPLLIKDNHIQSNLKKRDGQLLNGIRIYGIFGQMVILRNNHTIGFLGDGGPGIMIHYLRKSLEPLVKDYFNKLTAKNLKLIKLRYLWIAEQNIAKVIVEDDPEKLFTLRENLASIF